MCIFLTIFTFKKQNKYIEKYVAEITPKITKHFNHTTGKRVTKSDFHVQCVENRKVNLIFRRWENVLSVHWIAPSDTSILSSCPREYTQSMSPYFGFINCVLCIYKEQIWGYFEVSLHGAPWWWYWNQGTSHECTRFLGRGTKSRGECTEKDLGKYMKNQGILLHNFQHPACGYAYLTVFFDLKTKINSYNIWVYVFSRLDFKKFCISWNLFRDLCKLLEY